MVDLASVRAASDFPVFKANGAGIMCAAYGVIEIAANPTATDILSECKVPKGAVVIGGYVYGDDLDTNATETIDFDIGWAANGVDVADPDGFGNFGVQNGDAITNWKPVAGLFLPFQGVLLADGPKTFAEETTITATMNVAAATGGIGTFTIVAHYINP